MSACGTWASSTEGVVAYLLRRLALTAATLLIVAVAVFVLVRLIPGDPAEVMLGDGATPAEVAQYRHELGLDRPLPAQFAYWLGRIARGDFGRSIASGEQITRLVLDRFQVSAVVVLLAVAIASVIAVAGGLLAAWRHGGTADLTLSAAAALSLSLPSFWVGVLLLMLFGLKLGWLPVVGYVGFRQSFHQAILYVILPVATLVLAELGALMRMMRASALEVMQLEFVTHARAKGLSEARVLLRHVFPNAFAPTWSLIGLTLGHLLGGVAVIETVFTLPGLGRLMVDSVLARDYPVIQACLLCTAVIYVVVNLVVDLCYPLFDPRVRTR